MSWLGKNGDLEIVVYIDNYDLLIKSAFHFVLQPIDDEIVIPSLLLFLSHLKSGKTSRRALFCHEILSSSRTGCFN